MAKVAVRRAGIVKVLCVTPTYDGSGEVVHPDVWDSVTGWHGYRYWMAVTPYPGGNSDYENPSILVSEDGVNWSVPTGLTNPIDPKPATLFNSDTELFHNPNDDMLYCYYREQEGGVKLRTSADGVSWSAESQAVTLDAASPAVLWDGTQYVMWSGGWTEHSLFRRVSADPTTFPANTYNVCTVTPRPTGLQLWHQDVIADGDGGYIGVFTFCITGEYGAGSINYWARSADGLAWTVSDNPIIPIPAEGWDNLWHYRGSLLKTGSTYTLWYSARSGAGNWHVGRLTNLVPPV